MKTIRALVSRVGQKPTVELVNDALDEWQRLVGGYIQVVHLDDGVYLVCNEEGRETCPFNRDVPGRAPDVDESGFDVVFAPKDRAEPGTFGTHKVYGDFALARSNETTGEFDALTDDDIQRWTAVLT